MKYILKTERNANGNLVFSKDRLKNGSYQYEAIDTKGLHIGLKKEHILSKINDFVNVRVSGNSIYPLDEVEEKNHQKTIPALHNRVPYVLYGGCHKFAHERDEVKRVFGATVQNLKQAQKELKQTFLYDEGFDYYGVFVVLPAVWDDNTGALIEDGRVVYAWFGSYDGMGRVIKEKLGFPNFLEHPNMKEKWYRENIEAYYQVFEESGKDVR